MIFRFPIVRVLRVAAMLKMYEFLIQSGNGAGKTRIRIHDIPPA